MALCRACQAPIGWVRLKTGAPCPVQTEEAQLVHVYPGLQAGAGKRLVLITEEGEIIIGYVAPAGKGTALKAWEAHLTYCMPMPARGPIPPPSAA